MEAFFIRVRNIHFWISFTGRICFSNLIMLHGWTVTRLWYFVLLFFCHNIIMFRLKATLAKRLRSVFINIYIYCILLNQPQKHFLLKHQRKIHLFNCLSLHIQDVPKKTILKIAGFWLNFLRGKYNKRP